MPHATANSVQKTVCCRVTSRSAKLLKWTKSSAGACTQHQTHFPRILSAIRQRATHPHPTLDDSTAMSVVDTGWHCTVWHQLWETTQSAQWMHCTPNQHYHSM